VRNAAFLKLALLAAAASFAGGCTVHRYSGSAPAPANYSYGRPAYQDRYYENDYDYEPTRSGGKAVDRDPTSTPKPAKPDKPKAEKPNRDKPNKKPPRRNVDDDKPSRTNPGTDDDGPRRTDSPAERAEREKARAEVKSGNDSKPEGRTEIRPERKPTVKKPTVKPKRDPGKVVEIRPELKPTVKKPQRETEINAARRTTVKPRTEAIKPKRETAIVTAPRRTSTSIR
jgi:hypothetical protein